MRLFENIFIRKTNNPIMIAETMNNNNNKRPKGIRRQSGCWHYDTNTIQLLSIIFLDMTNTNSFSTNGIILPLILQHNCQYDVHPQVTKGVFGITSYTKRRHMTIRSYSNESDFPFTSFDNNQSTWQQQSDVILGNFTNQISDIQPSRNGMGRPTTVLGTCQNEFEYCVNGNNFTTDIVTNGRNGQVKNGHLSTNLTTNGYSVPTAPQLQRDDGSVFSNMMGKPLEVTYNTAKSDTIKEEGKKGAEFRDPNFFSAVANWADSISHNWKVYDNELQFDDATTLLDTKQLSETQLALRLEICHVLSDDDILEIETLWERIMPTIAYLNSKDQIAKVYKALYVAYAAHNGQRRKSGEPYIIHPVEVAILLAGLKLDSCTVCSGLLHDTVEDTDFTFRQVEELFGYTVRSIVEGETKVSKLPKQLACEGDDAQNTNDDVAQDKADEQAENLRQMFVAMTDDYRIIIVKLADRLHNMRTLQHMKPHKQIKISRETLDIFAPLAHRMGIWQFKSELEDTAFMYLYPTEYKRLHRRLLQHSEKFKETLESSKELLQKRLDTDPILMQQAASVQVMGRTKEIYSLWHKMETKNIRNLDNVMDVVALRVVITPNPVQVTKQDDNPDSTQASNVSESDRVVWLCYHVLGLVQHLHGFQPVPTRVKDYISFPKPNGYQSLHTALILNGQTIEVQIRTSMMHQVAEFGMASHWAYKEGKRRESSNVEEIYNTPWLSSIKEWQNDRISSRDFVDSVRRELLGKRVFVFLRNGKILNLARGATAIDAAFQIHTEVGLKMHGVEINGRSVPFSYRLKNGDVVSILTGDGKPATEWMRYAKSRSTRSKLRVYFRAEQRSNLLQAGKIILQDYMVRNGKLITTSSYLVPQIILPVPGSESFEHDLIPFLSNTKATFESVDDLLIHIGKNDDRQSLRSIVSQLFGVSKKILGAADEQFNQVTDESSSTSNGTKSSQKESDKMDLVLDEGSRENTDNQFMSPYDLGEQQTTSLLSFIDSKFEYADPEHLCPVCLPVYGDSIVGTKVAPVEGKESQDCSATVHRIGCPHAQTVINQALAERRGTLLKDSTGKMIDSVRLRSEKRHNMFGKAFRNNNNQNTRTQSNDRRQVPIRLEWYDLDGDDDNNTSAFVAEIVIHAFDRKLLLADCSVIVSDMSEIVKTGSQTNQDYATLVFLVKVDSVHHIQTIMDALSKVDAVMSVERRFGSDLL